MRDYQFQIEENKKYSDSKLQGTKKNLLDHFENSFEGM